MNHGVCAVYVSRLGIKWPIRMRNASWSNSYITILIGDDNGLRDLHPISHPSAINWQSWVDWNSRWVRTPVDLDTYFKLAQPTGYERYEIKTSQDFVDIVEKSWNINTLKNVERLITRKSISVILDISADRTLPDRVDDSAPWWWKQCKYTPANKI